LRVGIAACAVAALVLTDRFNLYHQQPGGLPGFSGEVLPTKPDGTTERQEVVRLAANATILD